jgi:hypothetical protein
MPTPASAASPRGALEIRGSPAGLLDEPLLLRVRGAGPDAEPTWRARYRDDDGRIWRATASRAEDLGASWSPAKDSTGAVAALRSLRPVSIEVRVETADGRAASRTITRLLAADGVRTRRWRDGLAATLHVPAQSPCATIVVDATAGPAQEHAACLAAPLLASRGVLALVVASGRGIADPLATARERLAAIPAASEPILVEPALDPFDEEPGGGIVLPPGVGARDVSSELAAARAAAWDKLLARLGAVPRGRAAAAEGVSI